jgi:hypothetical protein
MFMLQGSPQRGRNLRLSAARARRFSMRGRLIAVLTIAAALAVCAEHPASAQQGQLPLPPGGFKPPPPPPIKPYQAVPVAPPAPLNDPSFTAFRNQLGEGRRAQGPRRARQDGGGAQFFLDAGQESRRSAQTRDR